MVSRLPAEGAVLIDFGMIDKTRRWVLAPSFTIEPQLYSGLVEVMKLLILVICGCLPLGCFYVGASEYEDIVKRPSSEWTSRDRLTVIAAVAQTNMQDKGANIFVTAIPYYPAVITAINRSIQAQQKLTEEDYVRNVALTISDDTLSLLLRAHSQLMDDKGNYHKDLLELDSLMFYVSLTNKAWPCANPLIAVEFGQIQGQKTVKTFPLFSNPGDVPCPTPDISHLAENVFLMNDQNLQLHPKVIWGRRHETLTSEETLLMLFQLRSGEYHFFKKTKKTMKMVILGLEREIDLDFPLSRVR